MAAHSISLALTVLLSFCGPLASQSPYYAGALGGVSALSADGSHSFAPGITSTSLYKPENGPLLNLFGVHLNDYLSVQGNYVWNRNDVTLVSLTAPARGDATAYEQARASRQHGVFGDLLLYFRNRKSWVRPYLSAGVGAAFLRSEEKRLVNETGVPALPPPAFGATKAGSAPRLASTFRWEALFNFATASLKRSREMSSAVIYRLEARGTWLISRIYSALWSGFSGSDIPRMDTAANRWERNPCVRQERARGRPDSN